VGYIYIAAIATGDQRTVDDDITNILRPLIFPTLLEVSTDSRTPIDGAGAVVLSVVLKPYSPSAENKKNRP